MSVCMFKINSNNWYRRNNLNRRFYGALRCYVFLVTQQLKQRRFYGRETSNEHNESLEFFHFIFNPEQRRAFQLVNYKVSPRFTRLFGSEGFGAS
jgi:hypothetical protein